MGERSFLCTPYAVLAGDGSAQRDGQGHDLVEGEIGPSTGVLVGGVVDHEGMSVTVPGVRDYRHWGVMRRRDVRNASQQLGKQRDGYPDVFQQQGAQGFNGRKGGPPSGDEQLALVRVVSNKDLFGA